MKIAFTASFFLLLLLCSHIDLRCRIIPNQVIILLLILGLLNSWLYTDLVDSLIGIVVPSLLLLIAKSKWNFNIGAGDIKLLSAIGTWVGWYANLYVLLAGSALALIYVGVVRGLRREKVLSVPFAPFLSAAALFIYVGEVILQLYFLP
ncbi:prepilin peptidase [Paenibacillus lentus]|uniref:Prepilin peptidase n=1 Tax=Paenibacillus lentus TaxID=1338368 RepID=A0A3S8S0B6_9BACL|nr:A24 family peptidase [Paenibacillus lentus]AZK48643.1 prepilin peptidase [Paenibacillus lentus]